MSGADSEHAVGESPDRAPLRDAVTASNRPATTAKMYPCPRRLTHARECSPMPAKVYQCQHDWTGFSDGGGRLNVEEGLSEGDGRAMRSRGYRCWHLAHEQDAV